MDLERVFGNDLLADEILRYAPDGEFRKRSACILDFRNELYAVWVVLSVSEGYLQSLTIS